MTFLLTTSNSILPFPELCLCFGTMRKTSDKNERHTATFTKALNSVSPQKHSVVGLIYGNKLQSLREETVDPCRET